MAKVPYFEVTVAYYEVDGDRYDREEVYCQKVNDLDLQAVIKATNLMFETQTLRVEEDK